MTDEPLITIPLKEYKQLQKENTILRGKVAESGLPCMYCNLPAEDFAKCPQGFPGCSRGDDLMCADIEKDKTSEPARSG